MKQKRPQGRPKLPDESSTKPRSIRLTDARWEKLKQLGAAWLAKSIDKAKQCSPSTQSE